MMVSPGPRYLRTTSLDSPEMAEAQRRFRENFARNRAKFESSFEQEEESRRSTWTLSAIPPRPPVRRASSLRVGSEIMKKNNVGGQHNLQITQTDLREKKVTYTTSIEIQIKPDGGDAARRRSEGNSGRFTSFTKGEPVTLVDEERHEEKSDGRQFFTSTVTRNVALVYDVAKPEEDHQQNRTREASSSSKSSTISVTENKLPRTVPIVTNFRKFKAPE